jgi:magnesium chelatase subunit I
MQGREKITTLGALKKSGYKPRSIKEELRDNLIEKLRNNEPVFEGILGYEDTVIPDIQRAILSRHSMNLLGLRGQAKTRMARSMVNLLDEYVPVVEGSELNDDPLQPISRFARDLIKEKGDDTPIEWMHRSERYVEKLATPDVTVADLIGDADPIKAANLKLDYSDERVIHFRLVPRAHRSIFVINELPDLQPRIQVALFNILQEGDIQIRGFLLRLALDVQFVFTANPEDYTNRGAIITPLKDRIQSQILTHYPKSLELSQSITRQEAQVLSGQKEVVEVPDLVADLLERVSFEARDSEYIDQKSGVSARLTITAYENLVSTAERRTLINGEKKTLARIGDLAGVIPAITGKVELVYEGEQEGPKNVAQRLIGLAIRKKFPQWFPDPELIKRKKLENPYQKLIAWFGKNELELPMDASQKDYEESLSKVGGLQALVEMYQPQLKGSEKFLAMEFLLHGLAEFSLLSKTEMESAIEFSDLLNSLFSSGGEDDDEAPRFSGSF